MEFYYEQIIGVKDGVYDAQIIGVKDEVYYELIIGIKCMTGKICI